MGRMGRMVNVLVYELSPMDNRKSFYGKAKIYIDDEGNEFCGMRKKDYDALD